MEHSAEHDRATGFALRLERGGGRLVLGRRRILDLFEVEDLQLDLVEIPSRLDMSAGVDRFRHQRGRLDRLVVSLEDRDIGRALRAAMQDSPLTDLEVHAIDGDLVFLGTVDGPPAVPFVARCRLEAAGVARERALLISMYEVRVFGPCRLPAPVIAARLLNGLGLADDLAGPTAAVVDPIDRVLLATCAELGWKLPARAEIRIENVEAAAGAVRLAAARRRAPENGPRGVVSGLADDDLRGRRFLADYEAKTLYSAVETLIAEGRFDRAIAAYERQLDVHPDHPYLITRLLQLHGARPDGLAATESLARARLARHPDDPDAINALAAVQWRRDAPEAAAQMYRRLKQAAERRGDAIEAAQIACAIGGVLSLVDPTAAIAAYEEALGLRRRLPGALRALAELHGEVGDWVATLKARERLLAAESDPEARRQMLVELGDVALGSAGDVTAAQSYFERALAMDPDDVEALRGIAAAHEAADRLLPAVRALDRAAQRLQSQGDNDAAAATMVRLGDLWRRVPDGAPTAALRYRQALLLVPDHAGALLGLAEAAAFDGDPGRARDLLEELLRQTARRASPGMDRSAVFLRLGHLLAGALEDPAMAVTYFQKALDGAGTYAHEALESLEKLHTHAERWDDLARVLAVAADRARAPQARAHRLWRQAEIVRLRLADSARAETLLVEAASLAPDEEPILEALAEVLREREKWGPLAGVMGTLADLATRPSLVAARYAERAELLRTRLNRTEDAVEAYTLALGCDPELMGALEGLAGVYRERERYAELAPLLDRLAEVRKGERAGLVLLELGRLQADVLNRSAAAIQTFRRALERLPEDPEALRRLGDLHLAGERFDEALTHYERLYVVYESEGYDEPQAPFLVQLARARQAAGQDDEAVRTLHLALAADADYVPLYEYAQDLLLRSGDVQAIVDFLRDGLAAATRPTARAFLAEGAGRLLWRQLRDPEAAAPLLDEALELRPNDAVRRLRLEVATTQSDWTQVAALLRAQLEDAAPAARPGLLTQLARLALAELDDPAEGERLLAQALALDPDHVPALALRAGQTFAASDWAASAALYGRLVQLAGAHAPVEDRYRAAIAELACGEPARALVRFSALLDQPDAPPDTLGLTVEAAIAAGDAPALARVYEAELERLDQHGEVALLRAAGAVFGADPSWRDLAATCWERVLELVPDDPDAVNALAAATAGEAPSFEPIPTVTDAPVLAGIDADWAAEFAADGDDELPPLMDEGANFRDPEAERKALEAALEAAGSPADTGRALLALAEHQRDRLHDPDGSVRLFEAVLEGAPPGQGSWVEALEALEDIHAIREDWDALLALYDQRVGGGIASPDDVALLKASVLRRAGRLDAALAALADADTAQALVLQVDLLTALGRHVEAAERLLVDLDQLSASEASGRRWRAAELVFESDPTSGLDRYAEAYTQDPDPELLDEWLERARAHGEPVRLSAALVEWAKALPPRDGTDMRRSGAWLEAGRQAQAADDLEQARAHYQAALAAWSGNADALGDLRAVLALLGDDDGLAEALEQEIDISLPSPHQRALAAELAELLEARGDAVEAKRYRVMSAPDPDER